MKHLIALALAAALALSCAGLAMAEAQTYDLFAVGDKAMLTLTIDREPLYITIDEALTELGVSHAFVETEGVAPCMVAIAKSDVIDGESLGELGEEALETLKAIAAEQFDNPEILTGTVNGITYIAAKNFEENANINTIFTIEKGYFIQTTQYHEDFSALTEEDGAFALEVISGIGSRALE